MINQNETMTSKQNSKVKIIKRYQNRKLYDTQQSCYVTLDDIAKMIRTNEEVMVIDNKSKNDITAATLTQIIFEAEKKASQYAPLFTLREIIQNGNGSISNYLAKLGAFPQDYMTKQAANIANVERA
ncbi:MAG: regulator for granula-associated protein, partial [Proteobacteria bacterium]